MLNQFLKSHIATSSTGFTHTTMPGGHMWCQSFYIPPNEKQDMLKLYNEQVFIKKIPTHLTEAPDGATGLSPLKVDLDFRFMGDSLKRRYTLDQIKKVVEFHYNEIEDWLVTPLREEETYCFVFEKKSPSYKDPNNKEKRKIVKDGIHLMWPYMITPWTFHKKIRKSVIKQTKQDDTFKSIDLENKLEDVYDLSIIDRNNWLMYGSSKPNKEPYLLTHILQYKDGSVKEILIDRMKYTSEYLTKICSVRDRSDIENFSMFKVEKHALIEEEKQMDIKIKADKLKPCVKSRKSKKRKASENDVNIAMKLMDIINPERSYSYNTWIEVGWCLHNIHNTDDRLLEKFIEFSEKSKNHKSDARDGCINIWEKCRNEGLTMGTLKMWAKNDNPEKYDKIMQDNIWNSVKKLATNTHFPEYDIAKKIMLKLYGDDFICINSKKDVWYNYLNHRWHLIEGMGLKCHISTKIFNFFKLFHENFKNQGNPEINYDDDPDGEIAKAQTKTRNKKLSIIEKNMYKLKKSDTKNNVMNQCKEVFYNYDGNFQKLLDEKHHLIGFENGVYDLDSDVLPFRPGRPDDYITFSTKNNYIEYSWDDKVIKDIQTFMSQILPNDNVRDYMYMLLSTFLHGSTKHEKFHIWTGSGGNGKSKLQKIFEMAFGEYCCNIPVSLITQKRKASGQASPELERVQGKRFAAMQEPDEGVRINTGVMKSLTGGDAIMVRGLYEKPKEIKPQFKLVLFCNDLPKLPPEDGGTWRRTRVVNFGSRFVDNPDPEDPHEFQIDRDLDGKKFPLWKEGFMWILLQYYKRYKKEGLKEPQEILTYTNKYKEDQDRFQEFINDTLVQTRDYENDRLLLGETFALYKSWMKENYNDGKSLIKSKFKAAMNRKLRDDYDNPCRLKQPKGKPKVTGYAASGWWGWRSASELKEIDIESIQSNIQNIEEIIEEHNETQIEEKKHLPIENTIIENNESCEESNSESEDENEEESDSESEDDLN